MSTGISTSSAIIIENYKLNNTLGNLKQHR